MTLLAIDTTLDRCGALVRGAAGDVAVEDGLAKGHDARLAPMVREALARAGAAPGDLRRIVVAIGPGSFTGVRVGVAFARGLALALKIPAVGVTSLDALAAAAGAAGLAAAVHDARRGEVVWRAYRDGVPLGEPATAAIASASADLDRLACGERVTLVGTGASLLAGPGRADARLGRFPLAALADLGALADPASAPPEPFYHRPPDATPAAAPRAAAAGRAEADAP